MRPKAKYAVIHRHRGEYPISVMCKFFGVSRSGYYCFKKRLGETDRDAVVAKEIEECQRRTDKTYGYRRVWKWLKGRNIQRDPKTVLRIMKKYGLLSEVRRRRQWVNLGQQVHKYENLLNRQFRAVRPNEKWVTDISYIHTKDCKSADCESCSGHDSSGNEERESRCGVAAPQRPRLSIHIASILQANTILRHNAVHVKERKSL